jgi:hypothetical protein
VSLNKIVRVDSDQLGPIPSGGLLGNTLTCPSGGVAISAGYSTSGSVGVTGSNTRLSTPAQWAIDFRNPSPTDIYARMNIICILP